MPLDASDRSMRGAGHQSSDIEIPIDPFARIFQEAFCQHLGSLGILHAGSAERALSAAQQTGERLDIVLSKLGLLSDQELSHQLAAFIRMPMASPDDLPEEAILATVASEEFIRRNRILPLRLDDQNILIGIVDPFDHDSARALAYAASRTLHLRMLPSALFESALDALYGPRSADGSDLSTGNNANELDIERLRDLASEAPVIRLVNQLIVKAVEQKASDIHIEPSATDVVVRYRIDGSLRVASRLPSARRYALVSRLKIMSRLDIGERRLPQDGRIRHSIRGVNVDFRVSTVPSLHGESIVLRILDRTRVELSFDTLGFADPLLGKLTSILRQPNGIFLVTGPTGSGKTTTLYTALSGLADGARKIFTVEDPIEYELKGVTQIQVHAGIGLTFPHTLRAILRQDPDVIMIGEIRDLETARIAIQASLTGHLVLATLHTNSSAAAIARLADMGIEPYLISSTVRGILAQRLVRKLCRGCAAKHAQSDYWIDRLRRIAPSRRPAVPDIRMAGGCERCGGTGYAGRTTIAELMPLSRAIQDLIQSGIHEAKIDEAARIEGMSSLSDSGSALVWNGTISPDELLKAAGEADSREPSQ